MLEISCFFRLFLDVSDKRINKEIISISMKREKVMNFLEIYSLFNIIEKL